MKLWRKILFAVLLVAVSVPLAVAVIVQIPSIQTAVCTKAAQMLNESINGEIRIGAVRIIPFHTLIASDVALTDNSGDTLFSTHKLLLNVRGVSALSDTLVVKRISIDDTRIGIRKDGNGVTNFGNVLGNLLKKQDRDTSSSGLPWAGIRVRKISISGFSLNLDDRFRFSEVDVALRNIVLGEGVYGTIHSFSLKEDTGMDVEDLKGFFIVNPQVALLKDFEYKDNYSDIRIPLIKVKYGNVENFTKYADSVEVAARFDNAEIGLGSAAILNPEFKDCAIRLILDGSINGTLSDFSTKDLTIKTPSRETDVRIAAIVKGLPDMKTTDIRLNTKNSHTSLADITAIAGAFNGKRSILIPEGIDQHEKIEISCIAGGTAENLTAKVNMNSQGLGVVDAHISTYVENVRYIAGDISATNIDLGKITATKDLGKASAYLAGWAELNRDSLRAEIVTAEISKLEFKGYRYGDISSGITINKNHFRGDISSLDTNLYFKLLADVTLGKDGESHLAGSGNFSRIDLNALNLSKMDTCRTRFMIDFDFKGDKSNNYIGQIDVKDMTARLGRDIFDIGHIALTSTEEGNSQFAATLESSLLSASYQGNDYLYGIVTDAAELISSQLVNVVPEFRSGREKESGKYGEFRLITGDLKPVAAILSKNLYVNPGSTFKLRVNDHRHADLSLSSELVSYDDKLVKDLGLHICSEPDSIGILLTADMIQSKGTAIDRDTVVATVKEQAVTVGISYNDKGSKFGTGKLNAVLHFPDTVGSDRKLYAEILPSDLTVNDNHFSIEPSGITLFRNGNIGIDNFRISDSRSFLYLDGKVGDSRRDTLNAVLQDFDVAGLNFFIKKEARVKGILSGNFRASALKSKDLSFIADFNGNGLSADGEELGDIRLLSKWDESNQRINCLIHNTIDGRKPLSILGSYVPETRDIAMTADIDKFSINWVDPFLVGVLDHTVGTVSGKLTVNGKVDSIRMSGENLRLENVHTNLSYTKVPYILDGPFTVDQTGIYMDEMTIRDTRGSSGIIKGNYKLQGKDKGRIDLLFDLKSIHALNTTYHDANEGYYGDANATGKVRVFGPLKGLRINLDITTEDGTVHIPLDETTNVKKRDILTFVDKRNVAQTAYDSIISLRKLTKGVSGRKTGVKCNIRLKATPMTNLIVDINRANGDKASVKGSGQVDMRTGEGQFDIRGNYAIHEGNCHFSIMGITAKDFTILDGGSINFEGPVMQTEFKLGAAYQTKASLETLFGNTESVSVRRTVNCIVNLTGKIDNPEIKFKIDVPDLEPTYKSMLDAALSTDEKNLRQGLALLVSGGFIPDQQSGIVNNSTFLYSNASEIVSNQLSNIFHQLNIPIDLGLKYQPGTSGANLFDIAISTQLFNNRVTINGSIGNKEYMQTGASASDIVGNIDVDIKLNKTGQLKLNLFSHAADIYSNYLDQSQRNGAGITYQEEFATFKELWNNVFRRKQTQGAR